LIGERKKKKKKKKKKREKKQDISGDKDLGRFVTKEKDF